MGAGPRQRRLAGGIFDEHGRAPDPQPMLHMGHQQLAEEVRPCVVRRGRHANPRSLRRQRVPVRDALPVQRRQQIDVSMALESLRHGQSLGLREGVRHPVAVAQLGHAGRCGGGGENAAAIADQGLIGLAHPIPFQQGEFGMVQRPPLPVAEGVGEGEDPLLPRRQQLLAGEFRRGVQKEPARRPVRAAQGGGESANMGLVARGDLQGRGVHLQKILGLESGPPGAEHARARPQEGPAVGMDMGRPPGRGGGGCCHSCRALP